MPTLDQIRAARALLNWSQRDLAERTGLSQTGIARIESGVSQANLNTMDRIFRAFDEAGIEFLADRGVEKRAREVKRYTGQEQFRYFFDDIYRVARDEGGEICLFNGVPELLKKWLGDDWYALHAKRMTEVRHNFTFKVIVRKGESSLIGSGFAEYKYFPPELFNEKTIYIYGNKIAFLNFTDDEVTVISIDQAEAANSVRILFYAAWDYIALPIPKGIVQ